MNKHTDLSSYISQYSEYEQRSTVLSHSFFQFHIGLLGHKYKDRKWSSVLNISLWNWFVSFFLPTKGSLSSFSHPMSSLEPGKIIPVQPALLLLLSEWWLQLSHIKQSLRFKKKFFWRLDIEYWPFLHSFIRGLELELWLFR